MSLLHHNIIQSVWVEICSYENHGWT